MERKAALNIDTRFRDHLEGKACVAAETGIVDSEECHSESKPSSWFRRSEAEPISDFGLGVALVFARGDCGRVAPPALNAALALDPVSGIIARLC